MTFREGMLMTLELVLIVLTGAWVTGFVQTISHVESLVSASRIGAGLALGIGGVLLFAGWISWLLVVNNTSESLNTFTNRGLLAAIMLGGWLAGLVWSIIHLQGSPAIQVHPTITVLVISGILVLIFFIHWFWVGVEAIYQRNFGNSR